MKPQSPSPSLNIDNIPNEIWIDILKTSIDNIDHPWINGEMYNITTSIVLAMSQVCSRWRNIALSTPNLWTYITFIADRESSRHCPHEDLVALWLERSQSQLLRVRLLGLGLGSPGSHPRMQNCVLQLLETLPRWRMGHLDFYVSGTDATPWYTLQRSMNVPAPFLECLYFGVSFLHVGLEVEGGGILLPDKLWTTSARLRELSVSVYHVSRRPENECGTSVLETRFNRSRFGYHQLTHLCLSTSRISDGFAFAWEHIHLIFSRAPNLVSCFLRDIKSRSGGGEPRTTEPVVLRNLKHLFLQAYGRRTTFPTHLDQVLSAPSLNTLTISNTNNFNQITYARFMRQSLCQLDELHLLDIKIKTQDFLECLRSSPTLKVVHLGDIDAIVNSDACTAMTELTEGSGGQFSIVPNLQTLSFSDDPLCSTSTTTTRFKLISDLLKRRLDPPHKSSSSLKTLAIPLRNRSPSVPLQKLCAEPWNLQLVSNDFSYKVDRLWQRYGGQL